MKITVGAVVVIGVACGSVSAVLPWWQQPMARWVLRRGAVQWCWLTCSGAGAWAGQEAYTDSGAALRLKHN